MNATKEPNGSAASSLGAVGVQVLAMASFMVGASIAKGIFPQVGAAGATCLRLTGGALILGIVTRPDLRRWRAVLTRPVLLYGLAMGGMNLLFYQALATVPLGIAMALEFTGPLLLGVATSRALPDFLWLAMAVAGLILLLPIASAIHGIDPVGGLLAIAAGGCWALYIIAGKRAGAAHGAMTTWLGMTVGALIALPVGLWRAGGALLRPEVLMLGAAVAVLSSALPYSLEMVALRRLPVKTYATLISGEPAFGALAGFLLLGESLSGRQGLAIGLIVAAAAGAALTARRERPVAAAELVAA